MNRTNSITFNFDKEERSFELPKESVEFFYQMMYQMSQRMFGRGNVIKLIDLQGTFDTDLPNDYVQRIKQIYPAFEVFEHVYAYNEDRTEGLVNVNKLLLDKMEKLLSGDDVIVDMKHREELFLKAIFNSDYICKHNMQCILETLDHEPNYKARWNDIRGYMNVELIKWKKGSSTNKHIKALMSFIPVFDEEV